VAFDVAGPGEMVSGEAGTAMDIVQEASRRLCEGDAAEAIELLRQATSSEPDSPRLQFMMGLVAWRLGELDQALAIFCACHQLEPMNGSAVEVLASLFAQAGNLDESLYYGKLATALGPTEGYAELVPPFFPSFGRAFLTMREKPLLARAKLLIAGGSLSVGIDLAGQHVAIHPADREARLFLGVCLMRAGNTAAAAGSLQPFASDALAPAEGLGLYAAALAQLGEAAEALRCYEMARAKAPDNAAIAASRVADALWLGNDREGQSALFADWSQRFCRKAAKPANWGLPAGKIVISYLVSRLADRRDAAAIAAVAQAHDRSRVQVIGYGIGAQSWDENSVLSGAFDKWRDISDVDPATVARILRGDGVGLIIDCGGFSATQHVLALSRVNSAVRLAWLGAPPGAGLPIYDAVLAGGAICAAETSSIWRAEIGYPLVRDWFRPIERKAAGGLCFGTDATLGQFDEATVALWSAVLDAAPATSLLLRANDMVAGVNIDRLVARFGPGLAGRIDIVAAHRPEDFYGQVDIALAPLKGISPRMAAEAVACGVPVVVLRSDGASQPYGALLQDLGLGENLVAADQRDYVSIALGLAASDTARARMAVKVQQVAEAGKNSARGLARFIEDRIVATLSAADRS
jgi:protein O-GlcNAc transferase